MIIAQVFMMEACVSAARNDGTRRKRFIGKHPYQNYSRNTTKLKPINYDTLYVIDFDMANFWNWRSFRDYCK